MVWFDIGLRIFLVTLALCNVGLSVLLMRRNLALQRCSAAMTLVCIHAFTLREWPFELCRALRMRVDIRKEPDLDWIVEEFERRREI